MKANTGHLDDLSHISSEYCLADPLTKHSAKPDHLIQSLETGQLDSVDVRPPFRSLLKHKAFLTTWSVDHLNHPAQIHTVFGEDIHEEIYDLYHIMLCNVDVQKTKKICVCDSNIFLSLFEIILCDAASEGERKVQNASDDHSSRA